jgi:hypothetical protein
MLVVNVLLLIIGCLMTSGEAILMLAPLLAPLAVAYGYDKVMFGIIMIVNLEIGFLTPPVGLNLLVAMGAFRQQVRRAGDGGGALHRADAGLFGRHRLAALGFAGAARSLRLFTAPDPLARPRTHLDPG